MGVLEPLDEAIDEGLPTSPPDLQDHGDSGDDLFAEPDYKPAQTAGVFTFDKHIIPLMPAKGEYEDLLGLGLINSYPREKEMTPQKKKKNFCSRCFEEIKKDLKKLAKVVENFKNERDAVKAENESLKKEVERLKNILKEKEEIEKGDVRVVIDNKSKGSFDITMRSKNFQNARNFFQNKAINSDSSDSGISSFSINLYNQKPQPIPTRLVEPTIAEPPSNAQLKKKKTIAELRREFFAAEYQSEQKSFTARNYLEVKPEEKKETERSRLTIRVQPKQKINELFSTLSSRLGSSKLVPEAAPINLFQRFEKTRYVWNSAFEATCA